MNIAEMHVWFRQYAQQMGMQNVRAILPEQIDILINTSITDTINQLIRENIGITNDRVITDNSKIGQINALRSLYTVKEIEVFKSRPISKNNIPSTYSVTNITKSQCQFENLNGDVTIVGEYYSFMDTDELPYIYKCKKVITIGTDEGATTLIDIINTEEFNEYFSVVTQSPLFSFDTSEAKIGKIQGVDIIDDYMFLVDFSLNYVQATKGIASTDGSDPEYSNTYKSNYFPVRLIDDAYLADALNDFILKNRLRSPILTVYNDVNKKFKFDLYIDEFTKDYTTFSYFLANKLVPYKFRISYIAKPAKVQYAEDIAGVSVDCNLPSSMHVDILKHAVDLYRIAISGALSGAQQQQQAQQQEGARNNYRNEGNPQA